jgi:hypothetical protein
VRAKPVRCLRASVAHFPGPKAGSPSPDRRPDLPGPSGKFCRRQFSSDQGGLISFADEIVRMRQTSWIGEKVGSIRWGVYEMGCGAPAPQRGGVGHAPGSCPERAASRGSGVFGFLCVLPVSDFREMCCCVCAWHICAMHDGSVVFSRYLARRHLARRLIDLMT